ncbi:hypothetical protein JCM10449v2_003261 [Rhodotorula kratochvilovae]
MSSPPPDAPFPAAVPGYTDTGAFVYTVEYQQFCVEARKLLKEAQPGLKKKKLRKKIEKLWLEKHHSEAEPDDKPVSPVQSSVAVASASNTAKSKASQSRSTSAVSVGKRTSSTAKPQKQSQPAEQDWEEEESSDEGTPLGAHRIWEAVEDDQ